MPTPAQLVLIMLVVLFLAGAWLVDTARPVKGQSIPTPRYVHADKLKEVARENSKGGWWEYTPPENGQEQIYETPRKGAPLSAQVLEQIAQAQERDASNHWDY